MARARDFLGPYRCVRLIRVGTTCQVWEAVKQGDSTRYALKVLREDMRDNREEVNALKREFEIGSKLKHKNVIRIYEFNTEGKTPYLVMELFEFPNLKLVLRQGAQALAFLATRIIEQSAESLFYLHEQKYVHRDVKPDNFLVSDEGLVKLIDFAISEKIKTGMSAWFGGTSKIQGTRSYMSPEQIRGYALDARADMYSYGCLVYELFSGKTPYTGDSANDLLNRHLTAPIPALQASNDNVTPEFSNLVRRMMAKKKQDRPASMWDFVKEFRAMRPFKVVPKIPEGRIVMPREEFVSPDDLKKRAGPEKG